MMRLIFSRAGSRLRDFSKVAIIGDSRTFQQCSVTATSANFENTGYVNWLRFETRQAFDFAVENNFGIAGEASKPILDRTSTALAQCNAGVWILLSSTNDRGSDSNTGQMSLANIKATINLILGAGAIVIVLNESPRGNVDWPGVRLSPTALGYEYEVRDGVMILAGAHPRLSPANSFEVLAEPGSPTGDIIIGMAYDGLHFGVPGGQEIAGVLKPVADALFPARSVLPTSNSNQFNATFNATGSLNANPMATGEGGSVGTGGSGELAASWAGFSTATGLTRTYSKVSTWQQIVLGGTTPAGSPTADLFRQTGLHLNVAAGDRLEGVAEVEWDADLAGVYGLALRILILDGSTTVWDSQDMAAHSQTDSIPSVAKSGVMRTPSFVVPNVPFTDIRFGLNSAHVASTAQAGTIRVRAAEIRKIIPNFVPATVPDYDAILLAYLTGKEGAYYFVGDLSTLYEDRAGTVSATVDGVVGMIRDKGPNARHLVAVSDAGRGTLRQAAGLYYIESDGVDDAYVTGTLASSTAWTHYVAMAGKRPGAVTWNFGRSATSVLYAMLNCNSGSTAQNQSRNTGGAISLSSNPNLWPADTLKVGDMYSEVGIVGVAVNGGTYRTIAAPQTNDAITGVIRLFATQAGTVNLTQGQFYGGFVSDAIPDADMRANINAKLGRGIGLLL